MDRNLVGSDGGGMSVVLYAAFQLDSGRSNCEDKRLQGELGRSRVEADRQVMRKRLHVSVLKPTAAVGNVAVVTFSNELGLNLQL